jgi:hypothetical protein
MASLTIAIDPEILEAARLEAERRKMSLDQMVSEYVASIAHTGPTDEDNRRLIELIHTSPLGDLGRLPTREEIYAERTKWPRS